MKKGKGFLLAILIPAFFFLLSEGVIYESIVGGIFNIKESLGITKSLDGEVISKFKEKEFDKVYIKKGSNGLIRVGNINKANTLLKYLKDFKLINNKFKNLPYDNVSYFIEFYNENTKEKLHVDIDKDNKLIRIRSEFIKSRRDKEKNVITYASDGYISKEYEIYDDEIDLKYIEKIFNSLDT